jgi:hypothetical protein
MLAILKTTQPQACLSGSSGLFGLFSCPTR